MEVFTDDLKKKKKAFKDKAWAWKAMGWETWETLSFDWQQACSLAPASNLLLDFFF